MMLSQRAGKKTLRIYVANLVAQAAIVVTGVTVRLTGSGLGCPTWPECVEGSYTPTVRQQEDELHKIVEFGNRTLTFLLVVLAVAALVAAFLDQRNRIRRGGKRRGVLLVLAAIPFVGTFAQAILGGITVLTGLSPITVAAHLLLSMALIAGCVALVIRARDEGDGTVTLLVRREIRVLTWVLLGVTAIVITIGTVVTGSGPHSGDAEAENRFSFDPRMVSWLHADFVILFIGLTIALLLALHLTKAPAQVTRLVWLLIVVSVLQAALGYTQYFTGLPIALVLLHVIGATGLWIIVLFIPGRERVRDVISA